MNKIDKASFVENCKFLGLNQIALHYEQKVSQAEKENISYLELLYQLIELETLSKTERSIAYRIEESKLPRPYKYLKDYDFEFQPTQNQRQIRALYSLDFLTLNQSVLFIGAAGTGKSHFAQSLGLVACQHRHKILYTSCSNMLTDLNKGVYEKTLTKRLQKYLFPQLLIIDEMGHERLELEVTKEAHLLFRVIDERYKLQKSLIFTTNIREPGWAEYLGDPITTKAILDRIFHRSIVVDTGDKSYRRMQGEKLQTQYGI